MPESPAVSVVIPMYNAADLIGETLDSLRQQTVEDWEAIVVNDGSTDRSRDAVLAAADPRIRLIDQENRGVSAARNRGIEESRSEWVAFVDADDLWAPRKLESQLQTASRAQADLVFGPMKLFGAAHQQRAYEESSYVLQGRRGLSKHLSRNRIPQSTVMARRAALERVGGYDSSLVIAEDYDLWLRMLLDGAKCVYDPDALACYRILPDSHSSNRSRMRRYMRDVLSRAAMPSWALDLRRRLKLVELFWSQRRHEWRAASPAA